MMATSISNSDDVLDSRDIIARIEELRESWAEATGDDPSYFEDYARELAEDIGAINSDAGWPLHCIDWAKAAWELRMDYFSVDFDGIDYWVRS